jgi:hypothetical protein
LSVVAMPFLNPSSALNVAGMYTTPPPTDHMATTMY